MRIRLLNREVSHSPTYDFAEISKKKKTKQLKLFSHCQELDEKDERRDAHENECTLNFGK